MSKEEHENSPKNKVYIVDAYDDIPYGEYMGIMKVFNTKKLAMDWVDKQSKGEYAYGIIEEDVYYE